MRNDTWWCRLREQQRISYPDRKEPLKLFADGGVRWSQLFLMCERAVKVEKAILGHLAANVVAGEEEENEDEDEEEEENDEDKNKEETKEGGGGGGRQKEGEEEQGGKGEGQNKKGKADRPLNGPDMTVIRQVVCVLRSFYDATNAFQANGHKASISVIVPEIVKLRQALKDNLVVEPAQRALVKKKVVVLKPAVEVPADDVVPVVKTLREELSKAVEKRFGATSRLKEDDLPTYYLAASYLDPRKRDLPSLQEHPANPRKEFLSHQVIAGLAVNFRMWKDRHTARRLQEEGGGGGGGHAEEEDEGVEEEDLKDAVLLSSEEAELYMAQGGAAGGGPFRQLSREDHVKEASLELGKWLDYTIKLRGKETALEWWGEEDRVYKFPYLSLLARSLLAIPASSAGAERVFSQAGLTLGKLRQRMGPGTLEHLIILKFLHGEGHVYRTPGDWAKKEEEEAEKEAGKGVPVSRAAP